MGLEFSTFWFDCATERNLLTPRSLSRSFILANMVLLCHNNLEVNRLNASGDILFLPVNEEALEGHQERCNSSRLCEIVVIKYTDDLVHTQIALIKVLQKRGVSLNPNSMLFDVQS